MSDRLRVALVCGPLESRLDGVADAVAVLARSLGAAGAEVRIVHAGRASAMPGAWRAGRAWGPRALLRAAPVLRAADVVHVQFAPSMYRFRPWIGLLPVATGSVPLVTTLHEYGWWRILPLPSPLWAVLERLRLADREAGLLVPRSRAVVTTNRTHDRVLRRRSGGRMRGPVIPIGANVTVAAGVRRSDARRSVRAELGLAPDATLVAFFGFVHPVKGVRYLVDAVAALRAEGRDVHLLVVGGFESMALPAAEARGFEAELRRHVDAAGVAGHTTITGWVPGAAASRLLLAADLGALPFTAGVTTKSGSLLTLLAHGLPTVVTAAPEPEPELQGGDRCLAVGPVRDPRPLADGLRRLLDDPALAQRLQAAGRAFAAGRDWAAIAEQHIRLYRRVIR